MKMPERLIVWSIVSIFALSTSLADNLYWSGTGDWDDFTQNWAAVSGGPYDTDVWNNSTPDSAIFEGTAGTVSLWDPMTAAGLDFTVDGYTITASTLSLSGTPSINTADGVTATIASVLAGSDAVSKNGAGTLVLSSANTYSGKTIINAGTISIDADDRLGAAPGSYVADQLTFNGGGLRVTGSSSVNMSANRGITLGTAGGTLSNNTAGGSQVANFSQVIAGSGPLALYSNGNTSDTGGGVGGNLTLGNAANSFVGDVTIHAGVVGFNSDGSFGDSANKIIIAGGGLVSTDDKSLAASREIELSGGGSKIFRVYGGRTFTINGAITGEGDVRHTDAGTLQLNGDNSFTGNLISAAGLGDMIALAGNNSYSGYTHITNESSLRLDSDNTLPDSTGVLMYGNTTFNVNGRTDTFRGIFTGSGSDTNATVDLGEAGSTGRITVTNNSMADGSPANSGGSFYSKITGVGSLEYDHDSNNIAEWNLLNADNDFSGDIIVSRGRLRPVISEGAPAGFGDVENDIVFNGDIVATLGNNQGAASIQQSSSDDFTLEAGRSIILNDGKEGTFFAWGTRTITVEGQITGGGNLRKEDGGTLLINNTANDYTGLTRIAAGTITLGADGVLPDASGVEIADGNLNTASRSETVSHLFGSGGAVNGGGKLTVLTSGDQTYYGVLQSSTTLHMAGTGTQTLAGTADNGGGWGEVSSGTLVLAKTGDSSSRALGRAFGEVALNISGGTLRLDGGHEDQIYGDSSVEMSGGVFDFNGKNEGFRGLIGSDGVVRNDAASSTSTITVGEILNAGEADYTFSGTIADGAGQMALNKVGIGSQTLAGANTYTGATTVSAGTLNVTGSLASPVTVADGATLTGTGEFSSSVTLNSGSTLSPGASPGTMTLGGDLTLDGADLAIDIWGIDNHDLITFTSGSLTLANAPTITVDLNNFDPALDSSYTIIDGIADWDGEWGELSVVNQPANWDSAGKSFRIDEGSVMLTVIPEPNTIGMLLVIGAAAILQKLRMR
jgi:fibronectin-binding autotransporter adhesin